MCSICLVLVIGSARSSSHESTRLFRFVDASGSGGRSVARIATSAGLKMNPKERTAGTLPCENYYDCCYPENLPPSTRALVHVVPHPVFRLDDLHHPRALDDSSPEPGKLERVLLLPRGAATSFRTMVRWPAAKSNATKPH